jgi:hypothetical protein
VGRLRAGRRRHVGSFAGRGGEYFFMHKEETVSRTYSDSYLTLQSPAVSIHEYTSRFSNKNSAFYPQNLVMYCIWFFKQMAIILYTPSAYQFSNGSRVFYLKKTSIYNTDLFI